MWLLFVVLLKGVLVSLSQTQKEGSRGGTGDLLLGEWNGMIYYRHGDGQEMHSCDMWCASFALAVPFVMTYVTRPVFSGEAL